MGQPEIVTSPSQMVNLVWLISSIVGFFIHPIFGGLLTIIFLYGVIEVMCWEYKFYEDFVVEKKGVLNVTEETVNYFRIKSIKLERPFLMRLFGLSIIHVVSSERYKPNIKFYAVENGEVYLEMLQQLTKISRKEHGIKDVDIFYS
jgi:membrane protein YdbS with pleckstrin-like domain